MSPVPRAIVEAFYHALSIRDMAALANFLHDEVVWTISGPVDILPFCGQRVGKALVMKLLGRDSPTLLSDRRFVAKTMLVDGDSAAVLGRLTATKRASGQAISYRIAHFIGVAVGSQQRLVLCGPSDLDRHAQKIRSAAGIAP